VCALLVAGLLALGAGSYLAGRALHPPRYLAGAQLSLRLPQSVAMEESPLVSDAVLSAAMDRLETRSLRPFADELAMRQSLIAGSATFERLGENRFELSYVDANPDLAMWIVEAWGQALIDHLRSGSSTTSSTASPAASPAASPRFLRRPAYDPTPLPSGEQARRRTTGIAFLIASALYVMMIIITARRWPRLTASI